MKEILEKLFTHQELSYEESFLLMKNIICQGKFNEAQLASFLTVFRMRSISVNELSGFRNALCSTQIPINLDEFAPMDIVGTGGDGKNTFNISTCASFVVAGAGYFVAKQGNHSASSICGASDVLAAHGIRFTDNISKLKRSLEQCKIAYLHAPLFNPAMQQVASVRKTLGIRTLFNLIGPLINPCRPHYLFLGVSDLILMRLYVHTLEQSGCDFSVVNSLDGYDEISLTGKFKIVNKYRESILNPSDIHLSKINPKDIFGGNMQQSATCIFDNILQNKATKAQTECVIANAAFAIQLRSPYLSINDCIEQARESLTSGKAWKTFIRFTELNS